MNYKIKHYGYFGQRLTLKIGELLTTQEGWDLLRTEDATGFYSVPQTREQFESIGADKKLNKLATKIIEITNELNCNEITSIGVGRAVLEYNIKKESPEIIVQCGDYTPDSIKTLKNVFPECDNIFKFDMLKDNWIITQDGVTLLYRVSTELSEEKWQYVFEKMYKEKVEKIIFIPTEVLNTKLAIKEKLIQLRNVLLLRSQCFCG